MRFTFINVLYFKKAFDSIDRKVMITVMYMWHNQIPFYGSDVAENISYIFRNVFQFSNVDLQVDVLNSPFLFIIIVDFVMKKLHHFLSLNLPHNFTAQTAIEVMERL